MVVAEGIETAASAAQLLGIPGWSAVACGNLGRNRDVAGERAARAAWHRWRAEGRQARCLIPDAGDANDVLLAREAAHA